MTERENVNHTTIQEFKHVVSMKTGSKGLIAWLQKILQRKNINEKSKMADFFLAGPMKRWNCSHRQQDQQQLYFIIHVK